MIYGLFLFFFCFGSSLTAQTEEEVVEEVEAFISPIHYDDPYFQKEVKKRTFSEEDWRTATEGIDYSKSVRTKKNTDEDVGDDPNGETSDWLNRNKEYNYSPSPFWNFFVKILFFIIIGSVVVLLLIAILKDENPFKPRQRKIPKGTNFNLEAIEDNLAESDLDRYIREAEAEQNYPLAIRLYYLSIIKLLSQKKIIRYKKDKTNRRYMSTVDQTSFGPDFRHCTTIFERIWYGQNKLTTEQYPTIKSQFQGWVAGCEQLPAREKFPTIHSSTSKNRIG